jgi:hypothetical protein
MIQILWLVLIPFSLFALEQPADWSFALAVNEQHEFYKEEEFINKPKETWQHLFSIAFLDSELNKIKDCVYYLIPGTESGALKIKRMAQNEDCDLGLLNPGERFYGDIHKLSFKLNPNEFELSFYHKKSGFQRWTIPLNSQQVSSSPKLNESSAHFQNSRFIYLSPTIMNIKKSPKLPDHQICHSIDDQCNELKVSECHDCSNGWYEVPNGCLKSPKYCGRVQCGLKGSPACRRGMKWQKKNVSFDCTLDSSFAYCSTGLTLECQGRRAYCR